MYKMYKSMVTFQRYGAFRKTVQSTLYLISHLLNGGWDLRVLRMQELLLYEIICFTTGSTTTNTELQAIAIKLYSAVPHSMAEERTISVFTMLNTAQRNRQKVSTVVAMAQVGLYYKSLRSSKVLSFIFSSTNTILLLA